MPITYPRYTNSLTGYIHKPSDGGSNPQGGDFNPQYPFGFGLSYSSFEYSNLTINNKTFGPDESASIDVTVKNTGNREGKEVVQLFISELYASLTPDVKRLRGFEKIDLKPGESKVVHFRIPIKQLAYVNPDNKMQLEEGEFRVQTGGQSVNFTVNRSTSF